jgi:hypothetical protein
MQYKFIKYESCIRVSELSYNLFTLLFGAFCEMMPEDVT